MQGAPHHRAGCERADDGRSAGARRRRWITSPRCNLGGSRELTDDGLLQLARMPQLEHLNLSEYPGGKLTDRGLEVLRHLPNLRHSK